MEALTQPRYVHCACGVVFHRDTAAGDLAAHLAQSGHVTLTPAEVTTYIERWCTVCHTRRGSIAHGQLTVKGAKPLDAWVCVTCIDRATGVATA